ncbi:MAG: GWxTD domain-containing protein [Candidatus Acidiferrales bacterium]
MRPRGSVFLSALIAGFLAICLPAFSSPQQDQTTGQNKKESDKGKKKSDRSLFNELESPYKKWLNEDVPYIITPEERSAFLHLSTNEERESFIENFWLRRNPNPDSPENTFKEEHYRRIAYANEHYSSGIPGWKTDRGRIYIMWGPPDETETHPSGGTYDRPPEEGGGTTSTYPFEKWRYRYLEGIGNEVILEFVDPTESGEYHLTNDPGEKDALLHVPGAGLTEMESMGLASKADRFTNTDGSTLARPIGMRPASMDEFSRLELFAKIQQPPPVKFKDLEALVTSRIVRNQLAFEYRFDFVRVTSDTVLVPITVQIPNRQMSFQDKNGVQSATVNVFVRISTLSGRIAQTFEDVIKQDVPESLLQQSLKGFSIYQKAVPLSPGLYKLAIVLKDVNSNNVGVIDTALHVPRYEEDKLAASTLILADDLRRVGPKDIGIGQFVLGDVKVRPKMDATFAPEDRLGIFLQVYNLKVDDKTHKPDCQIEYSVYKDKDATPVLNYHETTEQLGEHGAELTLEKMLTLGSLTPGKYKLQVQVTDNLGKQTISPSADFTVKQVPASK